MMTTKLRVRVTASFFVFCCIYLLIILNLFFIQIWQTSFFTSLGSQQYHVTVTQLPPRAPILDRTGTHFLAMNKECISAFIIPNQIESLGSLTSFLKNKFPQSVERLAQKKNKQFMYIKRRLSPEELESIKEANLPDIHLLAESSRFYPLASASPLIGITDIDNNGTAGLELCFNQQLTGTPSTFVLEKDARSGFFYFTKELKQEGTQGKPIQLTIDSDLQFLVDEELAAAMTRCQSQEGAVIIMNPKTGEILAMSSHPYIDPNDTQHINIADMKHRAVTESYELGSVIKVFAAIAALEEGVVMPDELIDCKNSKTCIIDGRTINTWTPHGIIPFTDVMAYSNNIGIAQVAKRLGPALYEHYIRMGFGKKTGIPLSAESKGSVNHPNNWSKQSIISLSYGYEISLTILQLACAFCTIANDGVPIAPRLIMNTPTKIPESKPLYSAPTMHTIKDIMKQTTEHGTGHHARIEGYIIRSKTGTANMLVNGEYNHERNLYTCAAIVEKDSYQRVIVTFIKEAKIPNAYASTIAAPLLERVAEKMIIHERII